MNPIQVPGLRLKPGQTLSHPECGLRWTNRGNQIVELQDTRCPQCRLPLQPRHVLGGEEMVTWQLIPPQGMSFKNEIGGNVSIRFEVGREAELFQELTRQLHTLVAQALQASSPAQPPPNSQMALPTPQNTGVNSGVYAPSGGGGHAPILTISETGEVVPKTP